MGAAAFSRTMTVKPLGSLLRVTPAISAGARRGYPEAEDRDENERPANHCALRGTNAIQA